MDKDRAILAGFISKSISITNERLDEIVSHFNPRRIPKHDYFLKAGRLSDQYLFLETGIMRAFVNDLEGNEVTVGLYTKGNVIFEVASFFQRKSSEENMQALEDCSGWVLTYKELNTLFHSIPEFRDFGRAMLVRGFVALKERTLGMINKTAEERYADLVLKHPETIQLFPLKYIASYLGVTDSSLSRIRKDFVNR
jgi:CRP-like cAMP-binding protein